MVDLDLPHVVNPHLTYVKKQKMKDALGELDVALGETVEDELVSPSWS